MTTIERVCMILEALLLNGPMSTSDLVKVAGGVHVQVMNDLGALEQVGFIERLPAENLPARFGVGDRLDLILDYRKLEDQVREPGGEA